ncbi:hypothetical protein RHGRI_033614 [Rhododendron griersonianum]|uniref:Tetratricopeptide repeat protein 38 n=1 Tax=Rhododendron griersonianum TaxID=479676 RepID=A0AAV6HXF6_9ERIC|nr:hypothetical protein RHGRI_033614 [Rhododendron griersonianum]
MEGEVKRDRWGYEVNTSSDACISAINSYYLQVLGYGRKRSVILEAPAHDPNCVLANILAANFICSSNPSLAPSYLHAANIRLQQATGYEKAVFDALNCLISHDRDIDVAVELFSKILKDFPRDLVSLKMAQVLCFYMARPDLSLDLVEQVLPKNEHENYIYGMLSFALLEVGRMEDAEKAAKKGFEIYNEDSWAQHGLCHVLQYECRFKEAVEFMEECSRSWGSLSSFMYVYLNAVGLLLRVYIRGEIDIFGDRLKILGGCLTDQAFWYVEWHLDVLIVWALASTGAFDKGEDLLKGLKDRISKMSKKKQQRMQRGMLLAEALYQYGKGNNKEALDLLGPDFDANYCKIIGASDEQLDVFNEVWYVLLLNTGQAEKATEVIKMRVKKREGVPFMWRLLERGYSMLGRPEATAVGEKAKYLETAYFN